MDLPPTGHVRSCRQAPASKRARWLDAEDAATRQVLAWAMKHDPAAALRLAVALAPWWLLRGRRVPAVARGGRARRAGR